MKSYIVFHRVELTEHEATNAPLGQLELSDILRERGGRCLAAIPEKEFAMVAGLHALPNPPESKGK